jgi:hypothetical protein
LHPRELHNLNKMGKLMKTDSQRNGQHE